MSINFQILVGINESGKSNLLKAVSLLNPDIKLSKNDIRDPGHDEDPVEVSHVWFVYSFDNLEIDEIHATFEKKVLCKDISAEMYTHGGVQRKLFDFISMKRECLFVANLKTQKRYHATWNMAYLGYKISSQWKKIKKGIKDYEYSFDDETIDIRGFEIVNLNDYPLEDEDVED